MKPFLSLSYLRLSYRVFALISLSQILFAANEHLWRKFVDRSCLVNPVNLRILKRDAVVKSEADHEGIKALESLNQEAWKPFNHDLLPTNINKFKVMQDPIDFNLSTIEV